MPNGDKVKAATKHGPSPGEKARAISNAKKKAYDTHHRLEKAHNEARTHEDALRLTEHEQKMLEQKLKREAKAKKAAEFRALADAMGEDGNWPAETVEGQLDNGQEGAEQNRQQEVVRITKHIVQVKSAVRQPSEAELKAQVDAMLSGRRQALERVRHPNEQEQLTTEVRRPSIEAGVSDEDRLDSMLDALVERGVLSDAQMDRVTDALATGELSVQKCLEDCVAWEREGSVSLS